MLRGAADALERSLTESEFCSEPLDLRVVRHAIDLCRDAAWMLSTTPRRRRWKHIAHRGAIRAHWKVRCELDRITGGVPPSLQGDDATHGSSV